MTDAEQHIRLYIHPAPKPEEMAAIAAAFSTLVSRRSLSAREESSSRVTRVNGRARWASAGRREVLRSPDRDHTESG